MENQIGWANLEHVYAQPRVQKVAGFRYFYMEAKNIAEMEVGGPVVTFMAKMRTAYHRKFGPALPPPILAMYLDIPDKPHTYDVQVGFMVEKDTPALDEGLARDVEPTLLAGLVVGGNIDAVIQSYGGLMDFVNQQGLKCIEGWREYYLHWESDQSFNNITWVMHAAQEQI